MAFIVETGEGLPDATSYVSVAEADTYISIRPNATSWLSLDTEIKENYLMWATRLLDQRITYEGTKAVAESALRWPRIGAVDNDGIIVPYDTIPKPIKDATVEVAFYLQTQGLDPSVPPGGSTGGEMTRLKVDVIELEWAAGTTTGPTYFPLGLNDILFGLGMFSTGTKGFKRIIRA